MCTYSYILDDREVHVFAPYMDSWECRTQVAWLYVALPSIQETHCSCYSYLIASKVYWHTLYSGVLAHPCPNLDSNSDAKDIGSHQLCSRMRQLTYIYIISQCRCMMYMLNTCMHAYRLQVHLQNILASGVDVAWLYDILLYNDLYGHWRSKLHVNNACVII